MSDIKKFRELYDYHSATEEPDEAKGVLVCGRHDLRLVTAMGSLMTRKLARFYVPTGALGKDSGYLWELGITEAEFLASAATAQPTAIPGEMIFIFEWRRKRPLWFKDYARE